ncbi:MAG: flagellar export protein FliJ [Spirochaetales bacterium]|nr:flagellar export protein FliJ [Spirochaetales bacterium]
MKRFRFRLEQLLTLRRYREREWEIKLAGITGIVVTIENRIGLLVQEAQRALKAQFSCEGKPDYNFLAASEEYINRLRLEKKECLAELEKRKRELAEVQNEYLEHAKRRKVLEHLKERQEAVYYRKQRNEEAKVSDDMSTRAFIRKKQKNRRC